MDRKKCNKKPNIKEQYSITLMVLYAISIKQDIKKVKFVYSILFNICGFSLYGKIYLSL